MDLEKKGAVDLEKGNGLLVGRLGGLEKGRTLKEGRNERGQWGDGLVVECMVQKTEH